jgi:D-amino-acid dehydrogenase
VVIAAGAWSTQIASPLIEPLPLDTERGYHVMFPQDATLLTRPVGMADAGLYLSPLADGLRAAGTVELAGLHRPQNPRRLDYIERCVRRALPQAGQRGDTWLGFRPTLPDSLPVIGRSTRHSSLIYAFGHHHIGLTLGGITGRLVQQIIDDEAPVIDLTPYRPQRFND